MRKEENLPYKIHEVHMTVSLVSVYLAFTLCFAVLYALEE